MTRHAPVAGGFLWCSVFAAIAFAGEAERQNPKTPWPGQYKIKPTETERLTEADVVGPDGIVYPNWTKCGVQGGIPQVAAKATIEAFDGRPNDGSGRFGGVGLGPARSMASQGGGAVSLGEGTYHLDWPVTVRHDGVVIRGRGADKTKIIFRYALPSGGVAFYGLKSGDRVGKNTQIALHARPTGLATMTIEIGRSRGPRVEAQHAFRQHVRHQRQRPRDRRPAARWSAYAAGRGPLSGWHVADG